MRAFTCGNCGRLAPFESNRCLHCGAEHGFDWDERDLVAFWPDERARCRHQATAACNAVVAAEGDACAACALTRTRPADDDPAGFARFAEAEAAKRRLVFELAELGLPRDGGLVFDMLSSENEPVTTGHADGVVTIDLAEVDDAHREAVRAQMAEPYRTVLGHLRHEIGHYYQPIVVADWDACRALFGDERQDYQEAMSRHYEQGAPDDWPQRLRQRLRHDAPVGGLGRDLRPLPAHRRHAADRPGLWRAGGRPARPGADAGRTKASSPRSWPAGCR